MLLIIHFLDSIYFLNFSMSSSVLKISEVFLYLLSGIPLFVRFIFYPKYNISFSYGFLATIFPTTTFYLLFYYSLLLVFYFKFEEEIYVSNEYSENLSSSSFCSLD